MPRGKRDQPVDDAIDDLDVEAVRQHERQQRRARRRPHRGEIAEVHGQRAMPDGIRRHEPAIEVNSFNQCVGGQHVERAALGLNDRRVVTGTDEDPRWHREPRGDAGDERVLADV